MTEEDWRLDRGQEDYLGGAMLVWKPYRVWSETWEHDHCEFCWSEFVDQNASPAHREMIEKDPDILISGFAAQGTGPAGEDNYHWICEPCMNDFATRFRWIVIREDGTSRQ